MDVNHDVGFGDLHSTHVAISLFAIGSGFVVLIGLIAGRRLDRWTAFFLATTVATSVTGFGFPMRGFTPGIGIVSLLVLALAIYALYARHLKGAWRRVFVVGATIALYLNFLVLIVQSFQKIPALKELAPTQSESPFVVAKWPPCWLSSSLGTSRQLCKKR